MGQGGAGGRGGGCGWGVSEHLQRTTRSSCPRSPPDGSGTELQTEATSVIVSSDNVFVMGCWTQSCSQTCMRLQFA